MKKILRKFLFPIGVLCIAAFSFFIYKTRPHEPVCAAKNSEPRPLAQSGFSSDGNAIFKISQTGSKKIFDAPDGITISDFREYKGDFYITDAFKKRVFKVNSQGVKIWESAGAEKFIISNPRWCISISSDGQLWVANTGKFRLERLDLQTGKFLASWEPKAEFSFAGCCNPIAFAALSEGRFITMEKGSRVMRLFDASGKAVELAKLSSSWMDYLVVEKSENSIMYYDGVSAELTLPNF